MGLRLANRSSPGCEAHAVQDGGAFQIGQALPDAQTEQCREREPCSTAWQCDSAMSGAHNTEYNSRAHCTDVPQMTMLKIQISSSSVGSDDDGLRHDGTCHLNRVT